MCHGPWHTAQSKPLMDRQTVSLTKSVHPHLQGQWDKELTFEHLCTSERMCVCLWAHLGIDEALKRWLWCSFKNIHSISLPQGSKTSSLQLSETQRHSFGSKNLFSMLHCLGYYCQIKHSPFCKLNILWLLNLIEIS